MVKRIEAPAEPGDEGGQGGDEHPLMQLAGESAQIGAAPGEGVTDLDVAERAQQEAESQAVESMMAGVRQLALGAMRAVRTRIARNLPEIMDEWTDEALAAPVAASVPVINKYAAKWMPLLGNYPEETALAMSLLPLAMGYVAATEKHREKIRETRIAAAGQPL